MKKLTENDTGSEPEKPKTDAGKITDFKSKILANRLGQDFLSNPVGKKITTRISIRKPSSSEYFRTKGDFSYQTMTLKTDSGDEYVLDQSLWSEYSSDAKAKMFILCTNRKAECFLWAIGVPDPLRPNGWTQSTLEAVRIAQDKWVRAVSNMSAQQRDIYTAEGVLAEPEWLELTNDEIIELAFKDRFIEDDSHPILQQLKGRL